MIDVENVTDFSRSRIQLEEFWLFCLAVAGKTATVQAAKIGEFLAHALPGETPFAYVRRLVAEGRLESRLREVGIGKYALLVPAFAASAAPGAPDLETATPAELETLPGVGQKTSRYFILHTRRNARVAAVDTHVVKYLRDQGHRVPRRFPTPKEYLRLEKLMISKMARSGMEPAAFDLAVWNHYASGGRHPLPSIAA